MVTVTDFLLAHALLYSSAVLLPSAAFVRSPCCDLSKPPRGGPPLPLPRVNGKPPRPRPLGLPRVIIDIKACIIGLYYLGPLPIPTIFFLFGCIVICRPLNSVPSNRSAFCAVSALSNSTQHNLKTIEILVISQNTDISKNQKETISLEIVVDHCPLF